MKDLMIDIETLDTLPTAAVISIGAVYFDRKTGEIGDKFYARIDFEDACRIGTTSEDTMDWWNSQEKSVREEAFSGVELAKDVAFRFVDFCVDGVKPWGNGSVFDITIIENWFRETGVKTPWFFWNVRDVRTAVDLFNINPKNYTRDGVHHNALDDCLFQIKYLCEGMKGE